VSVRFWEKVQTVLWWSPSQLSDGLILIASCLTGDVVRKFGGGRGQTETAKRQSRHPTKSARNDLFSGASLAHY